MQGEGWNITPKGGYIINAQEDARYPRDSKTKGFPRAGFSFTFPLSIISSFPPGIIIALCTLKRPKMSYADNITISL